MISVKNCLSFSANYCVALLKVHCSSVDDNNERKSLCVELIDLKKFIFTWRNYLENAEMIGKRSEIQTNGKWRKDGRNIETNEIERESDEKRDGNEPMKMIGSGATICFTREVALKSCSFVSTDAMLLITNNTEMKYSIRFFFFVFFLYYYPVYWGAAHLFRHVGDFVCCTHNTHSDHNAMPMLDTWQIINYFENIFTCKLCLLGEKESAEGKKAMRKRAKSSFAETHERKENENPLKVKVIDLWLLASITFLSSLSLLLLFLLNVMVFAAFIPVFTWKCDEKLFNSFWIRLQQQLR